MIGSTHDLTDKALQLSLNDDESSDGEDDDDDMDEHENHLNVITIGDDAIGKRIKSN